MNWAKLQQDVNRLFSLFNAWIAFIPDFFSSTAKDVTVTWENADGTTTTQTHPNITKQIAGLEDWKNNITTSKIGRSADFIGECGAFTVDLRGFDKNKAYPLVFKFGSSGSSVPTSELIISRPYNLNSGEENRYPTSPDPTRIAHVHLHIMGADTSWSGNSNFMKILHHAAKYANTVLRADYSIHIKAVSHEDGSVSDSTAPRFSGVYLRGGIEYNIAYKNLGLVPKLYTSKTKISENVPFSRDEYAEPLPWDEDGCLPTITDYYTGG